MKTILFSAIATALFFGFYWLTLRRSNLFRLRRFYLVGTLALSLVLPFVSLEMLSRVAAVVKSTTTGTTLTTGAGQSTTTGTTSTTGAVESTTTGTTLTTKAGQSTTTGTTLTTGATKKLSFKDMVCYGYVLGCGVAFILLVVKLFKTFRYYRRSELSDELSTGDMCVRVLGEPDGNLPFSFLRSVFVNPEVFTESELRQVLRHERTHIHQHHTWDLLFTEVVRVMQWFNPFIYLYARELSSVHEYLADEAVLSCGTSRRDYLELLYKQLCVGKFVPVGNSFRHLLTKKRILMMNQPVKRRVSAWWLLALVPIIAGLLLVNCHPKEEVADELVEEVVEEPEDPIIYDPVGKTPDVMPEFPGGIQQYVDNLYSSMTYPELAKKYKLQGIFTVHFIVEKDGRIRHVELDTAYVNWKSKEGGMVAMLGKNGYALAHLDLGEGTSVDEESRNEIVRQLYESLMTEFNRAFRAAPACKPAMKDGQPVRCKLWLPAAFSAGENPTAKVTVKDPRSSRNSTNVDLVEADSQLGPHFLRVQIDTFPCETFVMQD
ncbi:MAG: M56 family metallopeptidase [Bacteroidales bacterium]|nr:M56 family metallopeptidase [Bacteroidales bacterium]